VALVTGSSRGLGRAIAEHLGARGARVVINHPGDDTEAAQEVVDGVIRRGGEASCSPFDVADSRSVARALEDIGERWGSIDVLVNNAGICPFRDFFDLDAGEWDRVLAVNARGVFLVSQAAARFMRRRRWGRIVTVSSISGVQPTDARQVAYCASKAAANMLVRSLALVLAPYGITVNGVLPGTVPTAINRQVLDEEGVKESIAGRTPLGRLGTPREVAEAVLFLASPENAWITGTLLTVDGGYTA
jgi:NAD(P)-dependent dehydrogenase (short-subunit alcohol dehydrogenase family)